ncbi:GAF domain-containing protein [Halorarum halobium]|uniref:GAF domain-containing protein n=1 Tax=Halorarum halobium TaxID=3075121 RepID=UPI0028A5E246|nr:GAF domain-containing protein [Halobaculum sp. XH14]
MSRAPIDARVLVAVSDSRPDVDAGPGEATAAALAEELGVETVTKRGRMAVEYLRELAPTVECIVCMSECADCVGNLTDVAPSVPLVVYGDEAPATPVDGIVARDGGRGVLADRVADQIRRGRERDRLDEANTKLTALNTYTRGITACETVEEVADTVVAAVTEPLAYGECVLALVEDDKFVPYGDTLPFDPEVTLTVDEGVAGRTYRRQESQLVDDYRADDDRNPQVPLDGSVASIPIGDHGVLQVSTDRQEAFDGRDVEFLEIVASHTNEALSRLRRETDLRVERDRLHAFFEGLPAPTVYVETEPDGTPVLREANAAYEAAFPSVAVGEPVESAFPTATERRLFADAIRAEEVVTESIERDTVTEGNRRLDLTIVPVRTTGLDAAGFGVYVADVTLP